MAISVNGRRPAAFLDGVSSAAQTGTPLRPGGNLHSNSSQFSSRGHGVEGMEHLWLEPRTQASWFCQVQAAGWAPLPAPLLVAPHLAFHARIPTGQLYPFHDPSPPPSSTSFQVTTPCANTYRQAVHRYHKLSSYKAIQKVHHDKPFPSSHSEDKYA